MCNLLYFCHHEMGITFQIPSGANSFLFQYFIMIVILDLKALYLLLQKVDDEKFQLGQQGVEVECCFICKAFRVCVPVYNR